MEIKYRKIRNLLLVFGLLTFSIRAQVTGVVTVPGTYTSIAAAITDLNTNGVSGAVTVNIAAGYTETAVAGGLMLNTITGASSANTIVFQKSGAGANPIVYAYTGTATPISAAQDGVWKFSGSDYITVDGINITDNNTTNPATMEYGYGFFKASATNGCQNNIIRNCVITLSRVNNAAGSSPALDGSRGIDVVNAAIASHTTAITITSAAGANSNNKFYSNTIQNCNIGIALIGFADATPFSNADIGNDIGGSSASTGNSIVNFGGGGTTSPAAGVQTLAQYSLNVSYNLINNNNGAGVSHARALRGIYLNTAQNADAAVTNNTITSICVGTSQQNTGIENVSGSTTASLNTVAITNNLITNCSYTTATSGVFYGIYNNGASPATLNVSNNTFSSNSSAATSGSFYDIYNTGSVTNVITINNNNIDMGNLNASSTSLNLAGVYNAGGTSTTTLSINNNTLTNANFSGSTGGTGNTYMIYNGNTLGLTNTNNNNFNNITLKNSASAYLIYNSNGTNITNANNNIITTAFNKTVAGGTFYGYYNFGSPSGGTAAFTGNNFSNITLTGATTFYGLYQATGTSQIELFTGNIISNVNTGASTIYGLYHSYGAAGSAVTSNTVNNLYGAAVVNGIYFGNVSPVSLSVTANVVNTCSTSGASGVFGIYQNGGTATYIYMNKIYDLSGNSAGASASGIYINAGTTANIYNNVIGNIRATAATGANAISGIYISGGTTANVYFNTVYLNGTSSGSGFGSAALYASTGVNLDLRNNILVNNSIASGSGITAAYKRSSTTLTSYSVSSNNNLFYAGTQAANSLLFYDGTNSAINLNVYKAFMSTRDAQSVTENPNFASTTGSAANYLNIVTTIPTLIESGALPVTGITTDYANTTRNVTTPDIGAWEGTFTPLSPCSGAPGTNTAMVTNTLVCTNGVTNLFPAVTHTATGLTYQWLASTTGSTGAYSPVTNATLTSISATLGSSSTWYELVTTCPTGPASATTAPVLVTVGAPLTTTAVAATTVVCSGFSSNLSLASNYSGVTYQWQSASALAGPYTSITNATLSTLSATNITANTWYQAVIGCSATAAYTVATTPASVILFAAPVYTNAPFLENFDNTWQNRCDVRNVPVFASWSSNPTTGNNSWRRQDDGGSASWTGATSGINAPLAGAGCANFHTYYAPLGTTGDMRLYIDLSTSPTYSLSFYYKNPSGSDSLRVMLSTNGGSTFTRIGGYITSSNWSKKVISLGAVNSSSCVISFFATSDYGNDDLSMDSLEIKTCPTVTVSASSSTVCRGTAVTLSATGTSGGAYVPRYVWSTAATTASISVTPTSTAVYTVTGTNGLCAVSRTVGITVNQNPTVTITGPTGICTGNTATLTASGAVTYSWNTTQTTASITPSPTVATVYSVTGTDALGCFASATQSVNASATLSINITGPSAICFGQTANLSVTGANTYAWDLGATTSTVAFSPTSTVVYTVTGTSGTCSNTATKSITVNLNPVVSISGTSVICAGQSTTLTATGGNTYTWSTSSTNASVSVSPATNTTYTVVGTSTANCSTSATLAVTSNSLPVLAIAKPSSSVCINSSATFTASGGNTYTWSANAGSATTSTVLVTVSAQTTYTLAGTSLAGCSASITTTEGIYALPVLTITPASPTVCSLAPTILTASGASTYTWNGTIVQANPTFTPANNPTYTVVGTDANGCVSSKTVAIVTNSLPIISASPVSQTICALSPASYTASGTNTFSWVNTGVPAPSTTVFPLTSTIYTVIGTNLLGCSITATVQVITMPLPNIVVTPAFTTVCAFSTNTYSASGAVTYTWNNNSAVTGSTAAFTTSALTGYSVSGTGTNGCVSSNNVFIVATNTLPIISIASSAATVCAQAAVHFTASGASSYTWSSGGPVADSVIVNPTNNNTYTVSGTDPVDGCVGTQTITVFTNTLPAVAIAPASPTVCAKTTLTLTAGGASSYTWSNGVTTTTITSTPTANVTYTLRGTDSFGCSNTTTVLITTNPLPVIVVSPPTATVCLSESITFTASGATNYTWTPVNVNTATVTITPAVTTFYTVTGADNNNCKSKTVITLVVDACTGIKANSAASKGVSLFPNPSTGMFTAKFEFEGKKTVLITNSVGQVVAQAVTTNTSENFDLSGLSKGIYFVIVSSKEASGNYKIVIE